MKAAKNKSVVDLLRDNVYALSQKSELCDFELKFLSKMYLTFKPDNSDFPYTDTLIIAQTKGVGSCYCFDEDPIFYDTFVGKDARDLYSKSRAVNIAILDSIYSNFHIVPNSNLVLEGSPSNKASQRANIILAETLSLVEQYKIRKPKIILVGAVGNILSPLSLHFHEIYTTDMDKTLIGQRLGGIEVEDGNLKTLPRVNDCDIAIVTGMTLSSNTFDSILQNALETNTKIVVFAQTGANLFPHLTALGVNCVISEEFPFYMFPGNTVINIHRWNEE